MERRTVLTSAPAGVEQKKEKVRSRKNTNARVMLFRINMLKSFWKGVFLGMQLSDALLAQIGPYLPLSFLGPSAGLFPGGVSPIMTPKAAYRSKTRSEIPRDLKKISSIP
jgi:hypothetical protein